MVDIFLRCCHQVMHKRAPQAPHVVVYSCSCACVFYLWAFHKRRVAQVCMCVSLTWPHNSCGADVRVFLSLVSSNFLPSHQWKCLQRHLAVLNVANMCCSEGSHKPVVRGSTWPLTIHLLVSVLISPSPPWAALGMLSEESNLGKFTE